MIKIREVLRLTHEGRRQREVANSVNASRSTVQECLRRAHEAGVSWPLPEGLDEQALQERLYPRKKETVRPARPEPDFERVMRELSRKHVTRRQLWREYRARCANGLQYTAFCVHLRRWRKGLGAEATLTMEHVPGDKLLVDYSGDPAHFVDRHTGEILEAQLFAASWAFSGQLYVEATATQNTRDWLDAHANALEAFGCCPAALVPDNTKTAVIKACRYDPLVNRAFRDFAEHYQLAVLPARVKKPRDKAGIEGHILVCQRRVRAALRDQVFFSIAELNVAIKKIVAQINAEPFQKRQGTRNSVFEQYDRPAARSLPQRRYEYAYWRDGLTVHPDYHVQIAKGLYSVHFTHIGKRVDARVSTRVVELFLHGEPIATHAVVERPWQRRTLPAHRPPEHQAYLALGFDQLMAQARQIGPNTATVLGKQALSKRHLDETVRGALGILRLAQDFSPAELERVCGAALQLQIYNYSAVRDLLRHGVHSVPHAHGAPSAATTTTLQHDNVRGAAYYAGKKAH
jgi:transposase